jgi:hypothetical protein
MNPKEKSKDLILKYKYHLDIELNNSGNIELSKLYSLIAVDLVLNLNDIDSEYSYYLEVKKEIENYIE